MNIIFFKFCLSVQNVLTKHPDSLTDKRFVITFAIFKGLFFYFFAQVMFCDLHGW